MNERELSRRDLLRASLTGAGALAVGTLTRGADPSYAAKGVTHMKKLTNAEFYDAKGEFLADKARDTYFEMMRGFNYPIPKSLEEGIWAIDFGLGDFVNVGMAGIFWWNDKENGFFGHEIFLLPGQMIVEHAHVKVDDIPAKMEAWHCRHGSAYLLGEGEPTNPLPLELPKSQTDFITVKHCEPLLPGEVKGLNRAEARHFMIGGPEGAIVTEYATYHDNKCLRFTNPGVKF